MKLFLLIYMGTHLGGVVGPLPYGMSECQARRDAMRAQQALVLQTGYSASDHRKLSLVELNRIRALRFECEYFGRRPSVAA